MSAQLPVPIPPGITPGGVVSPSTELEVKSLGIGTSAPVTAGRVVTKDSTLTDGTGNIQSGGSVQAGGAGIRMQNDGILFAISGTGGTDLAACARVSSPTVASGVAFTPSATTDSMLYVQTDAAVAGTYTITMGPTTGAEHVVATAVKQLVGSDDLTTVRVPASWKVIVTVVTVTIGHVLVVTC
ncbi:MAG: hypothetical protein M0Z46_12725 [Actinomycetota bacterium]|nr:hypothetical protein [Actinomycetota bacterium]